MYCNSNIHAWWYFNTRYLCIFSTILYMQKNDENLGTVRQLKMAKDVAQGMDYLSTLGFIYKVSYHCSYR